MHLSRLSLVAPLLLSCLPGASSAQAPLDSVRILLRQPAADSAAQVRIQSQATAYARAQVAATPNDPWAHRALCAALRANRDYDGAIAAARRATQLAPQVSSHFVALSNVMFDKAGDVGGLGALSIAKDAKATVEHAIALDPDNLDARQSLMEFYLQAPGIAGGDKDSALAQAREIARRSPVRGTVALLRVATAMNDENDLVFRFEQGLRLVTSGHDSLNQVRNTLVNLTVQVQSNDLKERFANRLFVTLPNDTIVRYARARLWTVEGKHLPEAAAIFQAYLALPKPPTGGVGFAGVHWRLGQVYEKLGRLPDALDEYQRSASLPNHPTDTDKDTERLKKRLGK